MKKLLPLLLSFLLLSPLTYLNAQGTQSGIDGKWVTSDSNSTYQYSLPKRFPKMMDNFKDSSVIIAGYQRGVRPNPSKIFISRTTNRGKSWHRIYEEPIDSAEFGFYQIQHPSMSHIIAISEKNVRDSVGNLRTVYFLMTSTDTANSWSVNDSIFGIYDVPYSFNFKGRFGMIRLLTPQKSVLLYSNDYGISWQSRDLPVDLNISYGEIVDTASFILADFSSEKLGYLDNFYSGSWQYENLPDTFSVFNIEVWNKDTIWSPTGVSFNPPNSRNIIRGTTDGGQNWNKPLDVYEIDSTTQRRGLSNIAFATKYFGAALGPSVAYFTEDGGKTWDNKSGGYLKSAPFQCLVYYYNPTTKKRLLLASLKNFSILKYEFEEPTGLAERENIENQLKLFPNPAKNTLFLELPKELVINNGITSILSLEGKEVTSFSLNNSNNGRHEISINNLPKGTYILQLRSNDYVGSKLFVKQ